MLLQPSIQKNNTYLVSDDLYEDYLFQYSSDSGDQCFNNESLSENQPEKFEQCITFNNDINFINNQQQDNAKSNSKQIQKDEQYEVQKDYNEYFNYYHQNQFLNNNEDYCQFDENDDENPIKYSAFLNGHNQQNIQKNFYQQINNSFSNNYNNNKQSLSQMNENVGMVSKNSQKQQQQAFSFNLGFQEEFNGIQVKLELNPQQNINEQITLPISCDNIRNNKDNQKQKSSQQNPNKFESIQISEVNSTNNVQNNYYSQMKVEQDFEQVIQSSAIPISRNYYQIFQEYQSQAELQKQAQQWQDQIVKNEELLLKSEEEDAISQGSTLANSTNKDNYLEEEEDVKKQDNNTESEQNLSSSELEAKQTLIRNSNKKNVVKNIMSAFKNFILEPVLHNYNLKDLDVVLEMYNQTKKGIDDLSEMQAKFKRYITSKNFNHYTVKLLIQHLNYSSIFKYFLNGPIEEWVNSSKISDIKSHQTMISFLKECFDDIRLIDLLKRHEKKRAHFQ